MNREYCYLVQPIEVSRARFRFNGLFLGLEVCWDTELLTVEGIVELLQLEGAPLPERVFRSITVGSQGPDGMALRVVLDIDEIDPSVIQKTMVMIRHYKCLALGYHEFGHVDEK